MAYSKDYFSFQLGFAREVAHITDKSLTDVLIKYTSFYKTLRIADWDFDKNNPTWQEYLALLSNSDDYAQTTYEFYLKQIAKKGEKNKKKLFGCFSYDYYEEEKKVQIHFRNTDDPEPGALSKARMDTRLAELKEMFTNISEKHPEAETVAGFSWLYSIEAYRRLFPPEYMHDSTVNMTWFRTSTLWGQFLDSFGELKEDLVAKFENCIEGKQSIEDLATCFPLKVLETKANISYFYKFYGIKSPLV
jgi:hypothetical protein